VARIGDVMSAAVAIIPIVFGWALLLGRLLGGTGKWLPTGAPRGGCAQCGVSYSAHPPGDGLTECPGDFGTITGAPREDDPS
jgi:hypothetical protein